MFKSKVQELCHKKSWSLPDYKTNNDGPLHNPRFISTVTVNGFQFSSPEPTKTVKEAQNNAAKVAFDHFSSQPINPNPNPNPKPPQLPSLPVPSANSSPSIDTLHLYKNQLSAYAHKMKVDIPVYFSESEGPPHALRFKCKVTVAGQTFESPKFFSTLKDAEHAAAEVALMSLSPDGVPEAGLYKNILQEFARKEGFGLPSYNTKNKCGEAHIPIFVSQVEIEGESFTGQEAKSKKQAEISAAKVAYMTLKERKAHQRHAPEFSSDRSKANVKTGLQQHANLKSPVGLGLVTQKQPGKVKGKSDQSSLFPLSAHQRQALEFSSDRSKANVKTGLQQHANLKSPASNGLVTQKQPGKDKGSEPLMPVKKRPYPAGNTNGRTFTCNKKVKIDEPAPSAEVSPPSQRVLRPRNKKVKYSDDKWVAY